MSDDLIKRLREPPYRRASETEDEAKIRRQNDREEAATALAAAQAEIARLTARAGRMEAALRSIAANTCCDGCQEAALVARAALTSKPDAGSGVARCPYPDLYDRGECCGGHCVAPDKPA